MKTPAFAEDYAGEEKNCGRGSTSPLACVRLSQ